MAAKLKLSRVRGPAWLKAALIVGLPILAINVTVAWLGSSAVFPLSPFFLGAKLRAIGAYALHRPKCTFVGHPDPGPLAAAAEERYHLPTGLLTAVIDTESTARPHRISAAGAMGLAQLQPATAARLGVSDPFDTAQSIDGAGHYLSDQLGHFHDLRLALAAYNAGPGNVKGRVPVNGETEVYVERVMAEYGRLHALALAREAAQRRAEAEAARARPLDSARGERGGDARGERGDAGHHRAKHLRP